MRRSSLLTGGVLAGSGQRGPNASPKCVPGEPGVRARSLPGVCPECALRVFGCSMGPGCAPNICRCDSNFCCLTPGCTHPPPGQNWRGAENRHKHSGHAAGSTRGRRLDRVRPNLDRSRPNLWAEFDQDRQDRPNTGRNGPKFVCDVVEIGPAGMDDEAALALPHPLASSAPELSDLVWISKITTACGTRALSRHGATRRTSLCVSRALPPPKSCERRACCCLWPRSDALCRATQSVVLLELSVRRLHWLRGAQGVQAPPCLAERKPRGRRPRRAGRGCSRCRAADRAPRSRQPALGGGLRARARRRTSGVRARGQLSRASG